ncbi:hypothetical protein PMKS-003763 [Pichia membranifaciens]|uniref:DNA polymerase delta subunit 3 n=1 Tax=Pichia membranifaciens TaxID=4926 RepID=A0A1Q2YLL5_9ASCO|nr:hypothetical protein PMKS-003763 [Pichia membranifaciens]
MAQEHIDYLANRLGISKKPVTARLLSREWMVPAKEASEIMHHFYTSHQTDSVFKDLSVKYSVCGTQKPVKKTDNEEKCERHADVLVRIVDKDDLNDCIEKLFASVASCQIYSMHLQSAVSLTNIIDICTTSDWSYSDENMTKCGILQTTTNGIVEQSEKQSEDQPVRRAQTEPLKAQKPVHTESKIQLENKTENKTEAKVEDHEKRRPVYVSRKASSNPTPSASASTKAAPEAKKPLYTSRKRNKEPSGVGSKDESTTAASKRAKTSSQAEKKKQEDERRELEKMLEDEFSDDAFENVNQSDDASAAEKETEYKYDDIDIAEPEEEKSKEETEESSVSDDKKEAETNHKAVGEDDIAEEPAFVSANQPAEPQPDVETYVDADGYVVRKINRKTAKPAQSSTTPAKSSYTIDTKSLKNKGGNSSRKQSNLMSFFKKKE